jgi:hemerythrin-like domain-containing protein
LTKVCDFTFIFRIENIVRHQIETVIDNSLPHKVVASLVTFINGDKQKHHIIKELIFFAPLTDFSNTFGND